MFTQKSKSYFLAFVIMGLLAITGTLFFLFYAQTFGVWFGGIFAIYGFLRFGIDLGRWIAKDAPAEKAPSKKAVANDREERARAWRAAVLTDGETP